MQPVFGFHIQLGYWITCDMPTKGHEHKYLPFLDQGVDHGGCDELTCYPVCALASGAIAELTMNSYAPPDWPIF
jgi:uncharacterized protein (DUF2062 family)